MTVENPRVTVLSGGVGGAKLSQGFYHVLPPKNLTLISNTADDLTLFGLRICPDSDILLYTLTDRVNTDHGWGLAGDTFKALQTVKELGGIDWFNLGDRDIGVHLYRTERLGQSAGLAEVIAEIARGFGLGCRLLPMCETPVVTKLLTNEGELPLQEYLVKRRAEPEIRKIRFEGSDKAKASPGVLEALEESDLVVIAPSNPLISIAPILSVVDLHQAMVNTRAFRLAVTPLVGGKSLKGPTDRMMRQLGQEVSPVTIARQYLNVIDGFVIDELDSHLAPEIEDMGLKCFVLPTVMMNMEDKKKLASSLVNILNSKSPV